MSTIKSQLDSLILNTKDQLALKLTSIFRRSRLQQQQSQQSATISSSQQESHINPSQSDPSLHTNHNTTSGSNSNNNNTKNNEDFENEFQQCYDMLQPISTFLTTYGPLLSSHIVHQVNAQLSTLRDTILEVQMLVLPETSINFFGVYQEAVDIYTAQKTAQQASQQNEKTNIDQDSNESDINAHLGKNAESSHNNNNEQTFQNNNQTNTQIGSTTNNNDGPSTTVNNTSGSTSNNLNTQNKPKIIKKKHKFHLIQQISNTTLILITQQQLYNKLISIKPNGSITDDDIYNLVYGVDGGGEEDNHNFEEKKEKSHFPLHFPFSLQNTPQQQKDGSPTNNNNNVPAPNTMNIIIQLLLEDLLQNGLKCLLEQYQQYHEIMHPHFPHPLSSSQPPSIPNLNQSTTLTDLNAQLQPQLSSIPQQTAMFIGNIQIYICEDQHYQSQEYIDLQLQPPIILKDITNSVIIQYNDIEQTQTRIVSSNNNNNNNNNPHQTKKFLFSSLTCTNIYNTMLYIDHVDSSIHMTDIYTSLCFVQCHQLRLHYIFHTFFYTNKFLYYHHYHHNNSNSYKQQQQQDDTNDILLANTATIPNKYKLEPILENSANVLFSTLSRVLSSLPIFTTPNDQLQDQIDVSQSPDVYERRGDLLEVYDFNLLVKQQPSSSSKQQQQQLNNNNNNNNNENRANIDQNTPQDDNDDGEDNNTANIDDNEVVDNVKQKKRGGRFFNFNYIDEQSNPDDFIDYIDNQQEKIEKYNKTASSSPPPHDIAYLLPFYKSTSSTNEDNNNNNIDSENIKTNIENYISKIVSLKNDHL